MMKIGQNVGQLAHYFHTPEYNTDMYMYNVVFMIIARHLTISDQ